MAAGLLLGDATAAPRAHLAVCRPRLHLCSWAPRPLRPRHGCRRLSRGYAPAARFAASASGGGGGGEYKSEEEERREREAEMRRRLKEAEEMDELERTAEELQNRASAVDESEEEKRERVRRELEKVAKEQAERRATAKQMFDMGQRAYGKGMYGRSIEFLEAALTIIRPSSLLGGEMVTYRDMDAERKVLLGVVIGTSNALQIQIWLAMAYDANRRHKDCIALYKQLERTHPVISIRRQAADFRYIAEAPKLKISNDEVVTIPQIGSSWDWYAGTWSDKIEEQEEKKRKILAASSQPESSANILANLFLLRPPMEWKKSDWAIVTLWIVLIGTAFYLQR